jgi:outer membrane receptor for Fe3+-dicitrate
MFLMFCFCCWSGYSQDLYIKTGKNFVAYNFTSSEGVSNPYLERETGNSYELGYSFPFKKLHRFSYDVSITLNELNASVGLSQTSVKYKTEYAGIQNSIAFSFLKFNRFALDVTSGFNVSALVYGKQEVNGQLFDLENIDGFKQVLVQPTLGLEANLYASKQLYLSLGYVYSTSVNKVKFPEIFSIQTSQFSLGVHFLIQPIVHKIKSLEDEN